MTVSVECILASVTWDDLGLERTKANLRSLQSAYHPDACSDSRAGDVFAKVMSLYEGPDFRLRLATGRREGDHLVRWTVEPGFGDRSSVMDAAHRDLAKLEDRFARFFTRVTTGGTGDERVVDYGEGWWFLSAFTALDSRTAVWVAKRLAAAVAQAAERRWVHGDINASTVVIKPAEHGLMLDGWWSAVRVGDPLVIRPTASTPPRYFGGANADAKLGVAQSAALLLQRFKLDDPLKHLFEHLANAPVEPSEFFKQVETVSTTLYGKPSWHPLANPDSPMI